MITKRLYKLRITDGRGPSTPLLMGIIYVCIKFMESAYNEHFLWTNLIDSILYIFKVHSLKTEMFFLKSQVAFNLMTVARKNLNFAAKSWIPFIF